MSFLQAPASIISATPPPHLIRPKFNFPPTFAGMLTSPASESPSRELPSVPFLSQEVAISALSENNVLGEINNPDSPATPENSTLGTATDPFVSNMSSYSKNPSPDDNSPTAAGSPTLPEHISQGTAAETSVPILNGTARRTHASSLTSVAGSGSRRGATRVARSREPAEFICKHDDCRRVFRRKTSLTNHTKAHNNKNSRSILRMKRIKRQEEAAQKLAETASSKRASDPCTSVQRIVAASAETRAPRGVHNDLSSPVVSNQWVPSQHYVSIPASASQQQHHMGMYPTMTRNGPLDSIDSSRGSPHEGPVSAMGGQIDPMKPLDVSHGILHSSDYSHSVALRHHHPEDTVGLHTYGNTEPIHQMFTPILPSWPPSSGLGDNSLAIANEIMYSGGGVSMVPHSVGETNPFAEMQQEQLAVDTNYLKNLDTLNVFSIPDQNAATSTGLPEHNAASSTILPALNGAVVATEESGEARQQQPPRTE